MFLIVIYSQNLFVSGRTQFGFSIGQVKPAGAKLSLVHYDVPSNHYITQ